MSVGLSYFPISRIHEEGEGDNMGTWQGKTIGVEVGLRILSQVKVSLAYQSGSFNKWESQNHSEEENLPRAGNKWDTATYSLSVSFPLHFIYQKFK